MTARRAHDEYDVLIVGAGIVGTSVAWRLARTSLRVALVERADDVADGATRSNSGIVHSGIHEDPDSETFAWCRAGMAWYRQWAKPLGFPFKERPTLIVGRTDDELAVLRELADRHRATLAPEYLDGAAEARLREPGLAPDVRGALYVRDSAQILGYDAARAMLENAVANGLQWLPGTTVVSAVRHGGFWECDLIGRRLQARVVVLATGAGAPEAAAVFGLRPPEFRWVEGGYLLLDRRCTGMVQHIVFGPPRPGTKGFIIQETPHGNVLLGPDAVQIRDTRTAETVAEGPIDAGFARFSRIWAEALTWFPHLERTDVIRAFSGIRHVVPAATHPTGFAIDDQLDSASVLALQGIKSPGLTAAPALADDAVTRCERVLGPIRERAQTSDDRIPIADAARSERDCGLVCRCEQIPAAHVVESLRRGARTIESIRWMTRAGMGRCQGAFCRPRVLSLIERETGLEPGQIMQRGPDSPVVLGRLR